MFAPDFRGHGKSSRVRDGYRVEDYGKDIIALLERRVGQPALIFGHSLGGMVATYVAACRPDLVRALVLGDNPFLVETLRNSVFPKMFRDVVALLRGDASLENIFAGLLELYVDSPVFGSVRLRDLPGNDSAFLRAWARSLTQLDIEALEMSVKGSASENWHGEEFLRKVSCPTLLLQGDPTRGGLMSDRDVEFARSLLHDCVHVKIDGIGHPLYMTQAEPVARVLLNFFASV